MAKLDSYCTQANCFQVKSHFATFEVHDLYSNISHSALIRSLGAFLVNPLIDGRHEKLSNEAIENLVQIALINNFFIFDEKSIDFVEVVH